MNKISHDTRERLQISLGELKAGNEVADSIDAANEAAGGDIHSDGSVAFTANQSMGGHKLTNLLDPTANQDAATKAYVLAHAGGTPTGGHNTLAYFDNSGTLASNAAAVFNDTLNSMSFGINSGILAANANGSLAYGQVASGGRISGDGIGSEAAGITAFSSGDVLAEGDASKAWGSIIGTGGRVQASGVASTAFGIAGTSAQINAAVDASLSFGSADGSGIIVTGGIGSLGFGQATLSGHIITNTPGDIASGLVDDHGVIQTTNNAGGGGFAIGTATGVGSSINAYSNGGMARGLANAGFTILAANSGAHAVGVTNTGSVIASGLASFAQGDNLNVTADLAAAFGIGNIVASYATLVIGQYAGTPGSGVTGTLGSWVGTDPLFVLGNGTAIGSESVAFQVLKNGTTFIADPSLSGSSAGWIFKLNNATTGQGAWSDTLGSQAVPLSTLYLNEFRDASNNQTITPIFRQLLKSGGHAVLDWDALHLTSGNTEILSLNWNTRHLVAGDGSTVIADWSAPEGMTLGGLFVQAPTGASDPAGAAAGAAYYNTVANKLKMFNGTTWETITSI